MTTLASSPRTGCLTSLAHSPAFVQPLGSASSPASSSPQLPAPAPARLQEGTPGSAGGCGYVRLWCCVGAFGTASPSPGPTPLGTALPLSRRG